MYSDTSINVSALKFVCGENENVCRLCFSSTEKQKVSIEDNVRLQKYYFDDTITFVDMFHELGVTFEPLLPQTLCMKCATSTINSYLFQKLCQYSDEKWSEALNRARDCLSLSETINPMAQSAYLIINVKDDNVIFTSRKRYSIKNKKNALNKIKSIMKSRHNYIKFKSKGLKIICEECGGKFNSKYLLAKHLKVHNKIKNPCPQCAKIFATPLQLVEHAERVHYAKKIKCPKCTKRFSTERMLKYHNNNHHIAAICKLCFVQFPSKTILRAHLDKHDEQKCPRCNKSFFNKHTFKYHLKICGNPEEKQPSFFCDICNKGYARKNGLRTHLKTDHGFGKVLSCKWCGKKFDAISRLRNHTVKHTRERNFYCEQCGGRFVTQAALVYHTRLHTGERPFPCDLCDESFLSASRRMEHKRRKHLGPSKECNVCFAKFITSHQLRRHMLRHSNPQSKLYVPENEQKQVETQHFTIQTVYI